MPLIAEVVDAVVGGDTHRDSHALEMTAPTGATISTLSISNDENGYADMLAWIAEHAPGPRVVIGLEGTRSYGIGLSRAVQATGMVVVEVERPKRADRRRGKSDPIDARLAALHTLRLDAQRLPTPRQDGPREAMRIRLSARHEISLSRTRQINRLRARLLTGDDRDRELARGSLNDTRLGLIARRRGRPVDPVEAQVRRTEARRLALAILQAGREMRANRQELARLVAGFAPALLDRFGVGPVSSAQAIVSWSHPGRCRSEAAFAALAGASPLPASSGRTVRHRYNRGGDRALNRALHDITLTRWRACPRTRDYIAKKRAQGRNDSEIRRSIKRYIARELFRALETSAAT